jgi:nitrogen-specific signal transduction histidine kinase
MEAIGTLTSGLAHDFNNMLAGIMGSLSMLQILLGKENLLQQESIDGYIETAMNSSQRASDMIRQLLTLSRKSEIVSTPVDLNHSLAHMRALCTNSFPKNVILDFRPLDAPLYVLADPTQIDQLLLNLCVNASQAMTTMRRPDDKKGGTLTVALEQILCDSALALENPALVQGQEYARLTITDTGVGMDAETIKRIFEPFYSMKKKEEGSGLGLSVVYGIIQRHGGNITVRSQSGRGSTFSVFLPLFSGETRQETDGIQKSGLTPGHGTILVIDDEEAIITAARGILTACGYTVHHEMNGREALEYFRHNHYLVNAVLLDMSLPELSGLEIFEELVKIRPDVPVLLSSGYAEDEKVDRAKAMGVRGFLQKPYTAEELARAINEVLI